MEYHHRFLGDGGQGENVLSSETVSDLKKRRVYYSEVRGMGEGKSASAPAASNSSARSVIADTTAASSSSTSDDALDIERTVAAALNLPDRSSATPSSSSSSSNPRTKRKREGLLESVHGREKETAVDRIARVLGKNGARRRISAAVARDEEEKKRERKANRW